MHLCGEPECAFLKWPSIQLASSLPGPCHGTLTSILSALTSQPSAFACPATSHTRPPPELLSACPITMDQLWLLQQPGNFPPAGEPNSTFSSEVWTSALGRQPSLSLDRYFPQLSCNYLVILLSWVVTSFVIGISKLSWNHIRFKPRKLRSQNTTPES